MTPVPGGRKRKLSALVRAALGSQFSSNYNSGLSCTGIGEQAQANWQPRRTAGWKGLSPDMEATTGSAEPLWM